MTTLIDHLGIGWLGLGVLLGIAELLAPGVFLIFLAVAAAIVGALVLLFPAMPIAAQLVGFAAWSVVSVVLGRRFYRELPVASSDPLLNDRIARLLGRSLTVTQPIVDGEGRVRVGDGEWLAAGPDSAVGTKVRVVGARGACLLIEPLPSSAIDTLAPTDVSKAP